MKLAQFKLLRIYIFYALLKTQGETFALNQNVIFVFQGIAGKSGPRGQRGPTVSDSVLLASYSLDLFHLSVFDCNIVFATNIGSARGTRSQRTNREARCKGERILLIYFLGTPTISSHNETEGMCPTVYHKQS